MRSHRMPREYWELQEENDRCVRGVRGQGYLRADLFGNGANLLRLVRPAGSVMGMHPLILYDLFVKHLSVRLQLTLSQKSDVLGTSFFMAI